MSELEQKEMHCYICRTIVYRVHFVKQPTCFECKRKRRSDYNKRHLNKLPEVLNEIIPN